MVKNIVTAISAIIIFIAGIIFERFYVTNSFNELDERLDATRSKIVSEISTEDDLLALQKFWIEKKHGLHVFLPHTEIKEIDMWIAEAVILVSQQNFDEAVQKIDVVIELCEQIPSSFRFKFENIF